MHATASHYIGIWSPAKGAEANLTGTVPKAYWRLLGLMRVCWGLVAPLAVARWANESHPSSTVAALARRQHLEQTISMQ